MLSFATRIHELALEAEIRNDPPKNPEKLNTELGFAAPRGSIQQDNDIDLDHGSNTTFTDTPDDQEPHDEEKQLLRRSM